jgi:hypothetical protein
MKDLSDGAEGRGEIYRPMALPEPAIEDRVEALELCVIELERLQGPFFSLYRQLERIKNKRDDQTKRCIYCGKSLKNKRNGARTCSNACRQAYYRHNRVLKSSIATKEGEF